MLEADELSGEFSFEDFDFEIVDEEEFDPFAPDPDDPEAVAADEIEELPVIKELPAHVLKPSVFDKSKFETPQAALEELFRRNPTRKPVLLAIIDFCTQERSVDEVNEMVDTFQKDNFSVYSPLSLCKMLERSGALVSHIPESAQTQIDEDGSEYLEIREPAPATWLATDEGLMVLSDSREGTELKYLIESREPQWRDIYVDILQDCAQAHRSMGAINEKYGRLPALLEHHKAPVHFIDCLEEVSAIAWDTHGWYTTDLGINYLRSSAENKE